MIDPPKEPSRSRTLASRCLSIDLEVGKHDGRIHRFAAVRGDSGEALVFGGGDLKAALLKLDHFAEGSEFLLGHNLIAFDLPHLAAAYPSLRLLAVPALDTLRLNPLAFPRNPYHHLVKHYQDGQLQRGRMNDPELDARLTLDLLRDQSKAFLSRHEATPALSLAWHWLTTTGAAASGCDALFSEVRGKQRPRAAVARGVTESYLAKITCRVRVREALAETDDERWSWAYALAWLSESGGNSVMPPWVLHQFPKTADLVRTWRDTPCTDAACTWCRERHDAQRELTRWLGLANFRPEPRGEDGRPLQQAITEAALRGRHVLAILPTGSGKSVCYQVPALSRYEKTGALTIVISPLVALMADQVSGLKARGIGSCDALNGLLSMPERADVLDRIRFGDLGIVMVSPEQLRNRALRKVLAQREIGAWVLDEAHCISSWGHDFRPDYRYVARFIRDKAGELAIPPILCLTATARPAVVADILSHFRDKLAIELGLYDGGANRSNLAYAVEPTNSAEKWPHVHRVLLDTLPAEVPGGAIVYCASRKQTEGIAGFLRQKGVTAEHFHAKLSPERKKRVQESFIRGDLRVIVATNAFGMGIDKPDVRLVIHADIPGSLESYLQEAGRAGRDQKPAHCVLLHAAEDVERQFGMSARARLTQREIVAILRALRALDKRIGLAGEVVATEGEILAEEEERDFDRDSATDDTRVRAAVAWLEEATLVSREENRAEVFPSSLRVNSLDHAKERMATAPMTDEYRRQLLGLVTALMAADADEGISTDELMGASGLSPERVCAALYDLDRLGIASNDTALTAFVHEGTKWSSMKRFEAAALLEVALIAELRLAAPDLEVGQSARLSLRLAAQRLRDAGHANALPEALWRVVRSLSTDGQGEAGGTGSLGLKRWSVEEVQVTLNRDWSAMEDTAAKRRDGAGCLLEHLLGCLPQGVRGTDLLVSTTLGKLLALLTSDLLLAESVKEPTKLLDRALLWLHEQEVIRLNKGLAVFRRAMTIRLESGKRAFLKADFAPLRRHYDEQILQIHVMAEYAQRGLRGIADAQNLARDYFRIDRGQFLKRWLPGRSEILSRQTTTASWHTIVESLNNPAQERIVTDEREQTNVLVLAGPGSGKTQVLVHRIAYLVRAMRQNPRGILALAYNRHAAVQIRRRLANLIADDAHGVTVITCHALAMRLAGVTFAGRVSAREEGAFDAVLRKVLRKAVALLSGDGAAPEVADDQRDRLLSGFRWILVDEYQDIDADQYELISALAGRTLKDEDRKLSLFAVGDDDQNVYAFNGASVEFIHRFEADYKAKPAFLTENYRSSGHIIDAANMLIRPSQGRMKVDHPISINRARTGDPLGGGWEHIDPVGQGRVQVLAAGRDPITQAVVVMAEIQRLFLQAQSQDWASTAVIAREWKYLEPVRSYCELQDIPVQMADEEAPHFWRLRETQALIEWLGGSAVRLVGAASIARWIEDHAEGPWWALLRKAVVEYETETDGAELPVGQFREWLAEWGREARRQQTGLLLVTAHRAKGLEFNHVAVLDGAWNKVNPNEDGDAPRRLYYVAMTRARKTLTLARFNGPHALLDNLPAGAHVLHRASTDLPDPPPALARHFSRLSLKDIDLGFAGCHPSTRPVHEFIAALRVGDSLELKTVGARRVLVDSRGREVGRLVNGYKFPTGMRPVAARVAGVIVWKRDDSKAEYRDDCRCEKWEVVVPDLVFEPVS